MPIHMTIFKYLE